MKFIASVAVAATFAAAVSAQSIPINDPITGATWTAGADNYLRWGASCKALGPLSKNVTIQLMTGPFDRVSFVRDLGTIDCSSDDLKNTMKKLPEDIEPGTTYSLQILTTPPSYSNQFTVVNPKSAAPAPAPATPAPATPAPADQKPTSAAGSLVAGSMVAAAGVAVAALQFIL